MGKIIYNDKQIGGGLSLQDRVQFHDIPQPDSTWADRIIQYTGRTNDDYVNGNFYKCTSSAPYSWELIFPYKQNDAPIYTQLTLADVYFVNALGLNVRGKEIYLRCYNNNKQYAFSPSSEYLCCAVLRQFAPEYPCKKRVCLYDYNDHNTVWWGTAYIGLPNPYWGNYAVVLNVDAEVPYSKSWCMDFTLNWRIA